MADWHAFANDHEIENLFSTLANDPVANFLLQYPPARMVARNDQLAFESQVDACHSMGEVFEALKTLRNNLFHGEKGLIFTERDHSLLNSGLRILEMLLLAKPELRGSLSSANNSLGPYNVAEGNG